jgi:hypothetical protein
VLTLFSSSLTRAALLLLAAAAAIGLGAFAGYQHGLYVERGRHALALQSAIVATHEAARADAAAESERRHAAALRDASAAAAARAARLTGQQHAAQTDRPDCRWPADRRVLINAAVAVANATPAAPAGGLPAALPGTAEPAR